MMDWRKTEIHFGKNRGRRLGDLDPKSLRWYAQDWKPEPYKGKISKNDLLLRAALDACIAEREEELAEKKLADAKAKKEEVKNEVEKIRESDYSLTELINLMRFFQLKFGSGTDSEQAACATVFIQAVRLGLKCPTVEEQEEERGSYDDNIPF